MNEMLAGFFLGLPIGALLVFLYFLLQPGSICACDDEYEP